MLHVVESEAKDRLSELLEAAERGDEVVIERGKRPAVRMVAVAPATQGSGVEALLADRDDTEPSPELGRRIVERLRGTTKDCGMSTDEIMAMTRGEGEGSDEPTEEGSLRGQRIVAYLSGRGDHWPMSADELMALTRGED